MEKINRLQRCAWDADGSAMAQGELRFCLRSEPKTFDPLKVEDDASVAIRYLTGGVLVRMNRQTQALEPGLAKSWKVSKDEADYLQAAQRSLLLRRHTLLRRRRCLYRQATDGPRTALANRRRLPLRRGERRDQIVSPTQISITFSCPCRRTRPAIRSGGDSVRTLSKKRDGGPRSVYGGRLQTGATCS